MPSPAGLGKPHIPGVTQTALQLLLGCGMRRGGQQTPNACTCSPPEVPPLSGTWDHFKASAGLGKLKSITEQLMKQFMSLSRETEGSTEEKNPTPQT